MVLFLILFIGGRAGQEIIGGMIDPVQDLLFRVIVAGSLQT